MAEHLFAACGGMDVRKIAFDAWNFRYLKPWLSQAGFEDWQLEDEGGLFDPFGLGYKSMSPALRVLESDILNRKIAHGNHPVLEMCAENAVVQTDPTGAKVKSERVPDTSLLFLFNAKPSAWRFFLPSGFLPAPIMLLARSRPQRSFPLPCPTLR